MTLQTNNPNGFVTIRYIVSSFLNEIGQSNKKNWRRFGQLAIDCIVDELNARVADHVAVHEAEINSAFTVPLPDDFIDYTKIAVVMNGLIWTLGRNDKIALTQEAEVCSCDVSDIINGVVNEPPVDGYYFSDSPGAIKHFGYGGGFNLRHYRFDRAKREVRFDGLLPGMKVYIEYQSTGLDMTTGVVQRIYLPTIKAYMNWKRVENEDTVPMGEKNRKFLTYHNLKTNLNVKLRPFRMDEFLDDLYSRQSQTVER
jgi:hypothetical protein